MPLYISHIQELNGQSWPMYLDLSPTPLLVVYVLVVVEGAGPRIIGWILRSKRSLIIFIQSIHLVLGDNTTLSPNVCIDCISMQLTFVLYMSWIYRWCSTNPAGASAGTSTVAVPKRCMPLYFNSSRDQIQKMGCYTLCFNLSTTHYLLMDY